MTDQQLPGDGLDLLADDELDALLEAEVGSADFSDDLAALLAPPADLAPRVLASVRRRALNQERLETVFDLLGLAWYTSRAMTDGDDA